MVATAGSVNEPAAGGPGSWRPLASVRELVAARELIANLVRRDLKVRHRGTFLGMLWSLTTPLLIVGLYYVIFTFLIPTFLNDNVRTDGQVVPFALSFFGGLTVWNFFSSSVTASTSSVVGSGYLLSKVYFPRAILPLSAVLSAGVTFCFEFAVLSVVTLLVVGLPGVHILWLPLIAAVVFGLASGLALLLSVITVFLRDVAHFVGVLMQLWFWATPIIYSLEDVSSRLIRLLELNPMTGVVVSFRNVVLLGRAPDFGLLAYDAAVAVALLVGGALAFGRGQRLFSEIV
ncbi:MAG: ABC transporter permease [Actinomycetota bacterium]|nr:ABC transporter permease [Actinomycetota bacterium]